jgi:hypothetical protein
MFMAVSGNDCLGFRRMPLGPFLMCNKLAGLPGELGKTRILSKILQFWNQLA